MFDRANNFKILDKIDSSPYFNRLSRYNDSKFPKEITNGIYIFSWKCTMY